MVAAVAAAAMLAVGYGTESAYASHVSNVNIGQNANANAGSVTGNANAQASNTATVNTGCFNSIFFNC